MNTQTQKNTQRIVATAAALVFGGVGMNILVMQTLGSFDAASVILALYLGFWAFVLGTIGLLLSSLWLFMKRKVMFAEPASKQPEAHQQPSMGLQAMCH